MPFPIWCSSCAKPTIIGQGVRFNAEKKKVGNYYSTPIFSFRMKHNVCGGWIEIRTDPKNTAYVVAEGAAKRDLGEDRVHEGEIQVRTEEERERLHNDAFAALEVKIDDRKRGVADRGRIEELQLVKGKDWEDPYAASMRLRRAFRVERKAREKNEAVTEGLKDRMSLGMELLEETEEDRRRAGFVDFGELDGEGAIVKARAKPLFSREVATSSVDARSSKKSKKDKAMQEAEERREKLRRELKENTRAAMDPFLSGQSAIAASVSIPRIKRKRSPEPVSNGVSLPLGGGARSESNKLLLVDYDSD